MTEAVLLGESPLVRAARHQLRQVAQTDLPVHLQGEIGTGKRTAARLLHQWSRRAAGPFLQVNLATLTPVATYYALYGCQQDAFGNQRSRKGSVELAQGGTLYLDGIDAVPDQAQSYLNAILKARDLDPGDPRAQAFDVRVVAATTGDLEQAMRENRFPADLYYCLYGFTIVLPPLRERREDVPLLAEHFLQRNAREDRVPRTTLTPAAAAVLKEQDWPGNLHELRHTIAMSMLAAQGSPIEPRHLHLEDGTQPGPNLGPGMRPTLGAAVRQRTAQVLDHTRGALPGPHRAVPSRQAGPSALRDRTREPDLPPPRRQAIQAQVTAVLADTARSPGSSARTSSLWPEARGPRPRHDVRPVPGATGR